MKRGRLCAALLALLLLAGCASEDASVGVIGGADGPTTVQVSGPLGTATLAEPEPEPESEPEPEPEAAPGGVAPAAETAPAEDVVEDGMVPVYAESLVDGTYPVAVDSSSSMFNVESCELTVQDGTMTARMHMGGTGYLKIYPGTAEQAASAAEADCVPFEEEADGSHSFTLPVEALDRGIDCAAFSKKKELWYDRTLVFRADSLPAEAFAGDAFATAESLGLADGEYTIEVALSGGSGRASVESPAKLTVAGGVATATIAWSSSNYDYMRIGEEKYLPLSADGNSTFEIPVSAFDRALTVYADTTAMSTPHEIEYTLTFDSSTIQ